jgi:dipeptidyl aminopeptidase/acylaminoacyl peptidase
VAASPRLRAQITSAARTDAGPQARCLLQEARDLTPGDHDVPPFNLGGQDMYAISPDGQELAYTSNIDEVEATSTNNEIFVVPMAAARRRKFPPVPAPTHAALFAGRKILAWRSQARAGFEADKWRLSCKIDNQENARSDGEVRSIGRQLCVEPDSKAIFYRGRSRRSADLGVASWTATSRSKSINAPLHADDLVFSRTESLFFTRMSIGAPNEIGEIDVKETPKTAAPNDAVTHMNDALLSQIDMQPLESFTFKGANDEEVQGFMVKPPGFDPNKKYPLKFLIHGGPQGAWGNSWTYRWNAELFAATEITSW